MKRAAKDGPLSEADELRLEVDYMRRMTERTLARMMMIDAQSIAIRHELEQKRRGFRLMADLAVAIGRELDYDDVFTSVSRRLNAALDMQRTAVLIPGADKGRFRASVLQGYTPQEKKLVESQRLKLEPEMLEPHHPVLITSADPVDRLAPLREALLLPYLISSPIVLHNDVIAVLLTGRLLEQMPYSPRLGRSDVESVQTVSNYLAAMLASHRLLEVEQLANYDPLTQLPNLRRTKEGLKQILSLAKRGDFSSAVMFVDLDGFKAVNDAFGHQTGDAVLRRVAEKLTGSVRESDLVGRIGGDEFLVVLSRILKADDAGVVAGKIIKKLTEPINLRDKSCKIGASIGIAIFPEHGLDGAALIKAADEAMYMVKNKGKNAYGFVG
ncbi:MAG: GGDEF domain-containing protein [Candidatus Adiutrix sp.]|jgi:diguanylate cyclase (GGDEF)-like protein|nr:GGDEF domain-containing protein [Candidatus Adiutrix sp.]